MALDISQLRLATQGLTHSSFTSPLEVVKWLTAVQSQDYGGAKWALGLRMQGVSDANVDHSFNYGAILRTHVMRPTWHFVTPADIRWMLELTAPRVHALNAYYYHKLGLVEPSALRSNDLIAVALEGGRHLTRVELAAVLQNAGIPTDGELRMSYILMRAELDRLICSGPRHGKQFTYALFDERAPQAKSLPREEALAELTRRYFTSHGPALIKDFVWWSGLTVSDAKAGIDMVKSRLDQEVVDGETYWFAPPLPDVCNVSLTAHLLPNYDEYMIGYTDHRTIFDPQNAPKLDPKNQPVYGHFIEIDGQIAGTWKRTLRKNTVVIESIPFRPFNPSESEAFAIAAQRFGEFVGLEVTIL